jgi:hypothetical protein
MVRFLSSEVIANLSMPNVCPSHFIPLPTSQISEECFSTYEYIGAGKKNIDIPKNGTETKIENIKRVRCISDERVIVLGMRTSKASPYKFCRTSFSFG